MVHLSAILSAPGGPAPCWRARTRTLRRGRYHRPYLGYPKCVLDTRYTICIFWAIAVKRDALMARMVDKVALVVGGAKGIGLAVAERLAVEGASVSSPGGAPTRSRRPPRGSGAVRGVS